MIKKLNKFLYSSIVISVLMCFLGLVFMIYPQMSFETINYVLAIILIVNGIYFMLENENNILFSGLQSIGIVELLLGVVLVLKPDLMQTLLPIIVGIVMVVKAFVNLRFSLALGNYGYSNWLLLLILSIISIVAGTLIIINPHIGSIALTFSLGFLICTYSVTNIIDVLVFKNHIKEIAKIFKN